MGRVRTSWEREETAERTRCSKCRGRRQSNSRCAGHATRDSGQVWGAGIGRCQLASLPVPVTLATEPVPNATEADTAGEDATGDEAGDNAQRLACPSATVV